MKENTCDLTTGTGCTCGHAEKIEHCTLDPFEEVSGHNMKDSINYANDSYNVCGIDFGYFYTSFMRLTISLYDFRIWINDAKIYNETKTNEISNQIYSDNFLASCKQNFVITSASKPLYIDYFQGRGYKIVGEIDPEPDYYQFALQYLRQYHIIIRNDPEQSNPEPILKGRELYSWDVDLETGEIKNVGGLLKVLIYAVMCLYRMEKSQR